MLGSVPQLPGPGIELAGCVGLEAIEALRRALVTENPLGPRNQQLVHFGQLLVLGHDDLALHHAAAARRSGATPAKLVGVVETALVTAGMPAYALGSDGLGRLFGDVTGQEQDS